MVLELQKNDNYNYWANLAMAMHIKYKVFSLGLINKFIFDCIQSDYENYVKEQCHLYKKLTACNAIKRFEELQKNELLDFEAKMQVLSWLEHMRWHDYKQAFFCHYGFKMVC